MTRIEAKQDRLETKIDDNLERFHEHARDSAVKHATAEGAIKAAAESAKAAHHRCNENTEVIEQVANWKVQPGPQGKPGSNKNWVVAAITSAGAAIAAYFAGKSQ